MIVIVQECSLSMITFAVREISNTAALMKLLLAIEVHVTTGALSPPLPARGRGYSRPSTLPNISHGLGMALKLPWSIYRGVLG